MKVFEAIALLIGALVIGLALGAAWALFAGFVLMWTISLAHELWWVGIPEIGYFHAVLLALPFSILVGVFSRSRSSSSSAK